MVVEQKHRQPCTGIIGMTQDWRVSDAAHQIRMPLDDGQETGFPDGCLHRPCFQRLHVPELPDKRVFPLVAAADAFVFP